MGSQKSGVWELLGHLSEIYSYLQTQLLAAPERGWARGGGVPSHWRAGLEGPRPRGSRMTGQVLTEASEGSGGRRGPLSRLSSLAGPPAVWKALAVP